MSQVQSVVFDRLKWNIPKAVKWLKDHGFRAYKVDIKPSTLRFRQMDPSQFKKYRTKTTSDGINLVIGFN